MPPTIAARPGQSTTGGDGTARLDAALFTEYRALSSSNRQVKGVYAATIGAALALIGKGEVATVYGRLRPGVWAIDVDLTGIAGQAVTEAVAGWAHALDVWHIVRPSGGADGRAHIFVATNDVEGLDSLRAELCRRWDASPSLIQRRDQVRPLSAPHRRGGCPPPLGSVREALQRLPAHLTDAPAPKPGRRRRGRAHTMPVAALLPRPRRARELPAQWSAYLATAARPPIQGKDTQRRSTFELVATASMIRAGWSHDRAWRAIAAAHPGAMSKARERGQAWWTAHVWNDVISSEHANAAPDRPVELDPELAGQLHTARRALAELAWQLPPRRRAAVLLVGHTILDRMARNSSARVPVPQRDLHLDTGLARTAISSALRALDGHVATLHTDPLDRRPKHRAHTSYEIELPRPEPGVSQILPPSFHTPQGPLPLQGAWELLPRSAHQVWRALHASSSPLALEQLCTAAHLSYSPFSSPTSSQQRSAAKALSALARVGLAICDEYGGWSANTEPTAQFAGELAHTCAQRLQHVEQERRTYRAGHGTSWSGQQRAALQEVHARKRRWWQALPHDERTERHAAYQMRYADLSLHQQHQLKDRLARSRQRAGIDEQARMATWVQQWSEAEWEQRVVARAAAFATLSPPEKGAQVRAWQDHRDRHHLPIARPTADTAIPPSAQRRDNDFLHTQQASPLPGMATLGSA